jgi:L-fuconolactonase
MMFGSDWPVCLLAASYERVFATYSGALHLLSAGERERVLGANAIRLYGLRV